MRPAGIPRLVLFLLFLLITLPGAFAQEAEPTGQEKGSGPLYSLSMYLPYLLFAQLPGCPARIPAAGSTSLSSTMYLTNDMITYSKKVSGEEEQFTIADYENLTLEGNLSHSFTDTFEAGGSMRIHLYYGGFLDAVIEGFHGLFGFPNGGREFFDRNLVYIDLQNNNGLDIHHEGTLLALGDTDLWIKSRLASADNTEVTGMVLVKVPTGALSGSSVISTGYPDLLLAVLTDMHPLRFFSFYFQVGYTIPGNLLDVRKTSSPYPYFSSLMAVEFHPSTRWSVVAQLNCKTPTLSGNITHWYFTDSDRLFLPQTDLLFGLILNSEYGRWQLFFTENFLTNAGSDITFGVRYSHIFRSTQ